jgi:adenylate cyclase class 2
METEIEAKWLEIEAADLRSKLNNLGAKLVQPERLMRRKPFDFPDNRLETIGGWVRVRDEGDRITLSYKQLNDRTLHGTKEITVEVNDFGKTCEILEALGLEAKSYQETKRETWHLGNCEVTIDTWPWIPTLVELEAGTEDQVRQTAQQLGLDWSKAMHGSVENAYQVYYDVTEAEVDHWPQITFEPVPAWLNQRRRN